MKQSKTLIITILMITLLLSSYVAFAAEYGSLDDPLVSLSYIKEILLPQTNDTIDEIVEERTAEYMAQLDEKMEEFSSEFNTVANNSEFIQNVADNLNAQNITSLVTISAGQTITFNSGTEFLLRIGGASLSNASGAVNVTTGTNTETGVVINNLYIVVEDAQTVTAASDSTILVMGSYILG
ncbi:MAG: hypothetical protein R3Y09_03430 [Clostridia bacterium]